MTNADVVRRFEDEFKNKDDLVADRISARGVRVSDDQPTSWTENHIYRLRDGRIVELWPGGGPEIG